MPVDEEEVPARQLEQAVEPEFDWYWPAAQLVQLSEPIQNFQPDAVVLVSEHQVNVLPAVTETLLGTEVPEYLVVPREPKTT